MLQRWTTVRHLIWREVPSVRWRSSSVLFEEPVLILGHRVQALKHHQKEPAQAPLRHTDVCTHSSRASCESPQSASSQTSVGEVELQEFLERTAAA